MMKHPQEQPMKAPLIAVAAAIFTFAGVVHAQTMVEYSNLSAHSAKALGSSMDKIGAAQQKLADKNGEATQSRIWEAKDEKKAPGKTQSAPAAPTPPAVFILSNGDRLESSNYVLTVDSLRVQQGDQQRTIPLSSLNMDATAAANRARGVDLKIPTSKSQIMLSF
jgi:hypothetical protein